MPPFRAQLSLLRQSAQLPGQELASRAKVSLQQARAIALRAVPGTITDQELEKEHGGTGLRYSFDIKHGTKTFEIGVDARTGAILERKVEGPNPDLVGREERLKDSF